MSELIREDEKPEILKYVLDEKYRKEHPSATFTYRLQLEEFKHQHSLKSSDLKVRISGFYNSHYSKFYIEIKANKHKKELIYYRETYYLQPIENEIIKWNTYVLYKEILRELFFAYLFEGLLRKGGNYETNKHVKGTII